MNSYEQPHPYFAHARSRSDTDTRPPSGHETGRMPSRTRLSAELGHIRVGDCMHPGILSCAADDPLAEVAGAMAQNRIHVVAITDEHDSRPLGLVSDLDVVAAAMSEKEPSALEAAATEPLTISAAESLERAGQLMVEHGISHLVVLDPAGGFPVGVLSTLDIASAYAG